MSTALDIQAYFNEVMAVAAKENATEHSYRSAVQALFNSIEPESVSVQNEPQRMRDVGAPDFSFHRKDKTGGEIVLGHCEAKDLGRDIRKLSGTEAKQQERYAKGLPNLIYTNCFDFDFYREGERVHSVSIAENLMGWQALPENFQALETALKDFASQVMQTITEPKVLAMKMAGKAGLIKDIMGKTLVSDKKAQIDGDLPTELINQYEAFKQHLIHDISLEDFADVYAETIAYGMFAARLHDPVTNTFSRQEALELLPKSNPFLRKLFGFIAGPDLDDRLRWVIDDLAKVFLACDLNSLMTRFGKMTERQDPFIHFYEDFLKEYNPKKRKARGVWYTPEPVVNFIVRAVDEVLKTEFGLADGLADTSKVSIDVDTGQPDKKGKRLYVKKDVHRVQVLDPATGTGTFLAEVIKQIAPRIKNVAPGQWNQYVEKELIPRIHGFELLMASYAMCHMKLDMLLTELGYKPTGDHSPRLSVYLTNSLEEGDEANQSLPFAQWISNESREASEIKRDMPIMCVIGNPPYSISSSNKSKTKGDFLDKLLSPYKVGLDESSLNSLSDDYVKFIRLAEAYIKKNGVGVFGFITNNSFTDGVVHRKMRQHLRSTFDKIYVFNLHGDNNKQEITPTGEPDENVFDIKQGVSITLGVSTRNKVSDGKVYSTDVWGRRKGKYQWLWQTELKNSGAEPVDLLPNYEFFKLKETFGWKAYSKGFSCKDFFLTMGSGVKFRKDKLLVKYNFSVKDVENMLKDVQHLEKTDFLDKYSIRETKDWDFDVVSTFLVPNSEEIEKVAYRPFDVRYAFYPEIGIGKIIPRGDHRRSLMEHFLNRNNFSLNLKRNRILGKHQIFSSGFVSDAILDLNFFGDQTYCCPIYIYPEDQDLDKDRRVNFEPKLWKILQERAQNENRGTPNETETFDYIYGVLYCLQYRETYEEFLKFDFPRIPWPSTPDEFWSVSDKGSQLRKLHLMEDEAIGETPYPFDGEGDSIVDKPSFKDGKVWINKTQFFADVPKISWEFYIGGYQPAQKWLKDRKSRTLSFDDIRHYQKIIKILSETNRIMKTITMTL